MVILYLFCTGETRTVKAIREGDLHVSHLYKGKIYLFRLKYESSHNKYIHISFSSLCGSTAMLTGF